MEIMLTPAINLLGSVLLNFKVYSSKQDEVVTAVIPEFLAEQFFTEYEGFSIDDVKELESLEDLSVEYPILSQYVLSQIENVSLYDCEYAEIIWAIDMGIPPGFPSYIQGYELK